MPRRRIIFGLIVVNLLLGAAVLAGPLRAQVFPKSVFFDCCIDKTCCQGCCWVVNDCDDHDDCRIN